MEALGRIDDIFSDYSIQLKPLFYDLFLVESSFCLFESDLNNVSLVSHSLSGTSEFIVAHVKCLKCSRFFVHYPQRYFVCTRSSRFVSDKISLDFRYPCQISPWDHIFLTLFWFYNLFSTFILTSFGTSQSDLLVESKKAILLILVWVTSVQTAVQ